MPISIKSERQGFRRCGIPHSIEEITYPDDRFTADELKRLQTEPMLIVEIIPDNPNEILINHITVAQIKDELDALDIEYSDKAQKQELFALYEEAKK